MTRAEKKAREMIANSQLADLLDEWEMTTNINDETISMIRGWLMDEFESRNPEAFNEWLDSEEPKDEDLREYMTR